MGKGRRTKRPEHVVFATRDQVTRCTLDGCDVHADGLHCMTPDAPSICHCPTCDYWGEKAKETN